MVLVDTSVWVDYLTGAANEHTVWLHGNLGQVTLGLTDLNYCEVLQGVRGDAAFLQVQQRFEDFPILQTGGQQLAWSAARNYRLLRKQGVTVRKTIDCLIATFCLLENHELLHRDRDFDGFEALLGLRVVHP